MQLILENLPFYIVLGGGSPLDLDICGCVGVCRCVCVHVCVVVVCVYLYSRPPAHGTP